MQEASYYEKLPDNYVRCLLCPHHCRIKDGSVGICRVRSNHGGVLYSDNYATACCIRFDPIEKKPLYHFYPGSMILSVGTVGCNFRCKFCQNWEISQTCVKDYPYLKEVSSDRIIAQAGERSDNAGIAYTYNEPTVWFEYMLEIAKKAKAKGMHNVSVTNGFIDPEPLSELLDYVDAFNVDLKAFTEDFYHKLASASLEPVKDTIKSISKAGKHLELTHLIVPGHNDNPADFEEMLKWIAGETGGDTPLHLSKYFPDYQLTSQFNPCHYPPVILRDSLQIPALCIYRQCKYQRRPQDLLPQMRQHGHRTERLYDL